MKSNLVEDIIKGFPEEMLFDLCPKDLEVFNPTTDTLEVGVF